MGKIEKKWDGAKCPICHRGFKHCPHTRTDAENCIEKRKMNAIIVKAVRKELKKLGLINDQAP